MTARLGVLLLLGLTGCPVMVERDGHHVFNPAYTFALESDDRERWQMSERILEALAVAPGMRVADVGAGSGWFTERFSRRVGAHGVVYATDVQPEMIAKLHERVREQSLQNVRVIEADFDDPALPAACCDLVFLGSVYKEIDGRVAFMKRAKGALAEGGRVAIVDFRLDGEGPPARKYRVARETVIAELSEAGYARVAEHDFLPRQYFLVFAPR